MPARKRARQRSNAAGQFRARICRVRPSLTCGQLRSPFSPSARLRYSQVVNEAFRAREPESMSLLPIVLLSAGVLLVAYFTYGRILTRLLGLRADVKTPAVELRDDVDYAPIDSKFLLSQHFSAIAAAGPIVGPILAGALFG